MASRLTKTSRSAILTRRFVVGALALTLVAASTSGCVSGRWNYTTQAGRAVANVPLTAGVLFPFDDERPPRTEDRNSVALGVLPLVLWGTSFQHRPDGDVGRRGNQAGLVQSAEVSQREREIRDALFTIRDREERRRLEAELEQLRSERARQTIEVSGEDLPGAAAISLMMELRASGMFDDVILIRDRRDSAACDVVFSGRLLATEQRTGVIWYGVTLAAPAFWVIGFPSQTFHVRTAIEVAINDYRGVAMDVYRHQEAAPTRVSWLWGKHYYRVLPELWGRIFKRVVGDAGDFFATRPRAYWDSFAQEAAMSKGRR